jgi:hypothetical protein
MLEGFVCFRNLHLDLHREITKVRSMPRKGTCDQYIDLFKRSSCKIYDSKMTSAFYMCMFQNKWFFQTDTFCLFFTIFAIKLSMVLTDHRITFYFAIIQNNTVSRFFFFFKICDTRKRPRYPVYACFFIPLISFKFHQNVTIAGKSLQMQTSG